MSLQLVVVVVCLIQGETSVPAACGSGGMSNTRRD